MQLFSIHIIDEFYADIIHFLTTGWAPVEFTKKQKKQLVVKAADFTLIAGHLYKLVQMKSCTDALCRTRKRPLSEKHIQVPQEDVLKESQLLRKF